MNVLRFHLVSVSVISLVAVLQGIDGLPGFSGVPGISVSIREMYL